MPAYPAPGDTTRANGRIFRSLRYRRTIQKPWTERAMLKSGGHLVDSYQTTKPHDPRSTSTPGFVGTAIIEETIFPRTISRAPRPSPAIKTAPTWAYYKSCRLIDMERMRSTTARYCAPEKQTGARLRSKTNKSSYHRAGSVTD